MTSLPASRGLSRQARWAVGITAGASTPAAHIEAVRAAICEMVGA